MLKTVKLVNWSEPLSLGERLGIRVSDFGYKNWKETIPESGFLRPLTVVSYLFGWDSDWSLGESYLPYPQCLWLDPEPPNPGPMGFLSLARWGVPATTEVGEHCAGGWSVFWNRFDRLIREADAGMDLVRKLQALKISDVQSGDGALGGLATPKSEGD